jgi:glycosyltransferase involved in cell wall biosynthesis
VSLGIKTDEIVSLSVCRLVSWKRVERVVDIINNLVNVKKIHNIKHIIVGEGQEKNRLEKLVSQYGITDNVIFIGAISHCEVQSYYSIADLFISTYDFSNVGNPLLEAIRAHKIIFTLNNGDTSHWIKHFENGFIYDISNDLVENISSDVVKLLKDPALEEKIIKKVIQLEKSKVWTWDERLEAEVRETEKLIFLETKNV